MVVVPAQLKLKAIANGKSIDMCGMFKGSTSGRHKLNGGPSCGRFSSFMEQFNEMHGMFNDSSSGRHQLYDGPSSGSACSFNEKFNEKYLIFVGCSIG